NKFQELCLTNHSLYTEVLQSINDAILISDMKGRVLWLNDVSADMCGLPEEKIIGNNVRDLEEQGIFSPSVSRMAIESGKNVSTVQVMKDGKKFMVTGHIVRDDNDVPILTVAHSRDITRVMENTSKMKEIEILLEKYRKELRKLTDKQSYKKV